MVKVINTVFFANLRSFSIISLWIKTSVDYFKEFLILKRNYPQSIFMDVDKK